MKLSDEAKQRLDAAVARLDASEDPDVRLVSRILQGWEKNTPEQIAKQIREATKAANTVIGPPREKAMDLINSVERAQTARVRAARPLKEK